MTITRPPSRAGWSTSNCGGRLAGGPALRDADRLPLVPQMVAPVEAADLEPQLGLQHGEEAAVEMVNRMQGGRQDLQSVGHKRRGFGASAGLARAQVEGGSEASLASTLRARPPMSPKRRPDFQHDRGGGALR